MLKAVIIFLLYIMSISNIYAQKIYRGNSSYSSDIVCTHDQGKVYRGNSTYSSDVIARFDGTNLYRGNSSYNNDIVIN